jgi:murein DD-endopeptidase MepM/ murein hydrolase activator NlpD
MNHAPNVNAILGYNEYTDNQDVRGPQMQFLVSRGATFVGHNAQHYQQRLTWLQALFLEWAAMQAKHPALRHIRLIAVNAPPGNSIPIEYARIVTENGGMLGHHPYTAVANGVIRHDDAQWYSGRWRLDDEYYRSQGLTTVEWIGTEAGPIYTAPAGNMGPDDGWRRSFVCDSDWTRYEAVLRYRLDLIQSWNALRGNRYRGDALFVSGSVEGPWRSFELSTGELHKLAPLTVPVPPVQQAPPPPPPPVEERQWDKLVYLVPQGTTEAQYEAVTQMAYDTRSEVTFSADAAFDRPSKAVSHTVVVYDAAGWGGQAALAAWVAAHYSFSPATVVEYREWPVLPSPEGEWDFPIGTAAERAAAMDDWPGAWFDANGYGNLYTLNGKQVYHTGVDLNCNEPGWDADKGAPVFAAANGVVTYAQLVQGSTWGKLVVIQHGAELFSRYAHLADYTVQPGQTVAKGQQIGIVGGVEYGLPNHLHFDVSPTARLLTYPLDWPGLTWSRIVTDYTEPLAFILARKQG